MTQAEQQAKPEGSSIFEILGGEPGIRSWLIVFTI